MPVRSAAFRAAALVLLAVVGLAGCGGGDRATPSTLATIPPTALPSEILGLTVAAEDSAPLVEGQTNSYVDAVGLFSFRKQDLLQATLQVTHLRQDAASRDLQFQRRVVGQILEAGSDLPEYRMDEKKVYLGEGPRQSVAVWFNGPHMMVLSSRADFDQSRALLRALVETEINK
jgi:hypothetical protein